VTSKHRYEGKENENAKLGNPGHHGETKARGGSVEESGASRDSPHGQPGPPSGKTVDLR
jgi:hypothetical protein